MWAAFTWDTIANWPPRTRGELFLHESFHIVQPQAGTEADRRLANEHLDAVDGRYWLRLEWRALARALRESGEPRVAGRSRGAGLPPGSSHAISGQSRKRARPRDHEGLASYTGTVLAAPSAADAIARAVDLLAGRKTRESFVRTFTYTSGPAYGLLLDASSPGWTRTVRGTDDPAVLLMRALGVQPVADAAASAARYGGAELRAAEEQREQQRQARISPSCVGDSLTARCS